MGGVCVVSLVKLSGGGGRHRTSRRIRSRSRKLEDVAHPGQNATKPQHRYNITIYFKVKYLSTIILNLNFLKSFP